MSSMKKEMKKFEDNTETGYANFKFIQTDNKVSLDSDVDVSREMVIAMLTDIVLNVKESIGEEAATEAVAEMLMNVTLKDK